MPLTAPYLISLCDAAQNSDFSFGVTSRLTTQSSTFNLDAAKLIRSIVTFSPASESVAIEFLHEFQKVWGINHLGKFPLIYKPYILLTDDTVVQLNQSCSCDPNLSRSSGHKRFWYFCAIARKMSSMRSSNHFVISPLNI
jgi:hypothetical protein